MSLSKRERDLTLEDFEEEAEDKRMIDDEEAVSRVYHIAKEKIMNIYPEAMAISTIIVNTPFEVDVYRQLCSIIFHKAAGFNFRSDFSQNCFTITTSEHSSSSIEITLKGKRCTVGEVNDIWGKLDIEMLKRQTDKFCKEWEYRKMDDRFFGEARMYFMQNLLREMRVTKVQARFQNVHEAEVDMRAAKAKMEKMDRMLVSGITLLVVVLFIIFCYNDIAVW